MNASKLFLIPLAIATAAGVGMAQSVQAQDAATEAPLSRAEVLANMQIWRESGSADLQSSESASDPTRPEYIAAMARYRALRASPEFAQRVARIERERAASRQFAKQ
jgi:hypothetical protein